MAKIKVGSGFGRVPFAVAAQRAMPGDSLVLDPGHYEIGDIWIQDISVVGVGAPEQVVLVGAIRVRGHCALTNLTLHAMPYKNAVLVNAVEHAVTLTNCVLQGEPGAKYPPLWCDAGTLVLAQVAVYAVPGAQTMHLSNGGTLHATGSLLGKLNVVSSKADLIDSTTEYLQVSAGGRVGTYGLHRCVTLPDKRAFHLSGQSACTFGPVLLGAGYEEGYVEDSVVQFATVTQGPGGALSVLTAQGARVITNGQAVRVIDTDATPEPAPVPEPAPAAPPAAGPRTVHWPLAHAEAFGAQIAPQLRAGDTVVLDAGEYTLSDYELLLLGANLVGQGPDETVIRGSIGCMASGQSTLRDLTVCARDAASSAINLTESAGRLTLQNVSLWSPAGAEAPTLRSRAGTLVMRESTVAAPADRVGESGRVRIEAGAQFEAERSELGWFSAANGTEARLSDCASYQLDVETGATVTVADRHFLRANQCDQLEITVSGGGALTLGELSTDSDDLYVLLDGGSVELSEFSPVNGAPFTLQRSSGTFTGIDPSRYVEYEPAADGAWLPVHAAQAGEAAAQVSPAAAAVVGATTDPVRPEATEHPHPDEHDSTRADAAADPLAQLHELVGLAQVKQQAQGFVNLVKLRQKRAELGLPVDDEFSLHSMFLGNPGTGKTTAARIIGTAMYQAGVVSSDAFVEAGRAQLVSENIGGTAIQTRALLEQGRGGVVFIDEAYSLATEDSAGFAEEAVTEILTFMENNRHDTMVILAGYPDKMHELLAVNEGMRSRITHRFDFEDYSTTEIAEIGMQDLARGDYTVSEDLYRRVIGAAYARSADRSNARWVRNFNQELRAVQGDRVIRLSDPTRDDLTTIRDEDVHALAGGDPESRAEHLAAQLAQLDALVGLAPVKAWVRTLVEQATVNQRLIELDGSTSRPNYHVAFTGNPGTGKTTVARIVAEIFSALGILTTPTVKNVAASQLVGKYLGHSADQTHRACDAAMGGVLFVDEAHQLRSTDSNSGSLKQEVVEALITRLEDDRDKFVAVFAGYTEPMHEFFAADPGLRSRIPAEIEFPDYSAAEVAEIAGAILAQRWVFDRELCARVAAADYERLPASERSNGRWARTFAEAVVARHNAYLVREEVHGEAMRRIPDEVFTERG